MISDIPVEHQTNQMTSREKKSGLIIAMVFSLRMFGLFLIFPIFSMHAPTLEGGEDPFLIGFALGAFGLTQAIFHIPFGTLSDRFGRFPLIFSGLFIFAIGCFISGISESIYLFILGRIIQGMGAISSVLIAFSADITRPKQYPKIMAGIGICIGISFLLSLSLSPMLYKFLGMNALFFFIGGSSLFSIFLLKFGIKDKKKQLIKPGHSFAAIAKNIFKDGNIMLMNIGIFILHFIQVSIWIILPNIIHSIGIPLESHWKIYLPTMLMSFFLIVPFIRRASHQFDSLKTIMVAAIILLAISMLALLSQSQRASLGILTLFLMVFFTSFNILESIQPSVISRLTTKSIRGTTMGIFSTMQSLGIALGGIIGGIIVKSIGSQALIIFSFLLAVFWLILLLLGLRLGSNLK